MSELTKSFEKSLERFGVPQGGERLSAEELASYRGKLPNSLLEFWEAHGLGIWLDGFFQFCNPDKYQSILKFIFAKDNEFKSNRSYVIGMSAFGELLVWNRDYRIINIDVLYHSVICDELFDPAPEGADIDDINVGIAIKNISDASYDLPDRDGKPMFKRALKALGSLDYGEIYALKLHPALGGPVVVENLGRKKALEALAIAAQAGPFRLIDASTPQMRVVREI
ncbi:GAD-like domain-containing protein [Afifella sp. YEN Y35]|uniref:GAD-like domain-containing protein n=1 Tax=Afifella sp. YEN Y35 TaxID=3388337 RepID=UPI0039E1D542